MITKLPSNQDVRSVMITNKKCFKIAKMYFENVLAISNEMVGVMDNAPDVAAENFVEICIQDARIEELFDEQTNKLQLSFFLIKLLNEFKHQDVSNAVEHQRQENSQIGIGGGGAYGQPSPDGFRSPMGEMDDGGDLTQHPMSGGVRRNPRASAGGQQQQQMMEGMDTME